MVIPDKENTGNTKEEGEKIRGKIVPMNEKFF